MKRILCWLIGVYYSIKHNVSIDGHYYEMKCGVTYCTRCGHIPLRYERISINAVKCCRCGVILFHDYSDEWNPIKHECAK